MEEKKKNKKLKDEEIKKNIEKNENEEKKDKVIENKNDETDEKTKEKLEKIIKKAKEKGKITYGELATELTDATPNQMEQVFDAIEKIGININEDFEDEPDEED